MIYIFGYGSLIFADGINGRGMKHQYTDDELREAQLYDYLREWNAVWQGKRFFGLTQHFQKGIKTNGVVFPISEEDLIPFKASECIPACYRLEDVTKLISLKFNPEDVVYTCVTNQPSYNGIIPKYYLNTIKRGLNVRSEAFNINFRAQHNKNFSKEESVMRTRTTNYDFSPLDYNKIDPIIKNDPGISWGEFKKLLDAEGIKCSQYSFFARKAFLAGKPFGKKKNRKPTSVTNYSQSSTLSTLQYKWITETINKLVPNSKMKDEYATIAKELFNNPTVSHAQLQKNLDIKMCDANFYQFRKKFNALKIKWYLLKPRTKEKTTKNVKGDMKKFLKLLESHGKITVDEAIKKMKCPKAIIYGLVFRLRKKLKKEGVELAYEEGFYFIKSDTKTSSQDDPESKQKHEYQIDINTHFAASNGKKHAVNDLKELSELDLDDYLDAMKKSIFYELSAQAIITANNIIKNKKEIIKNI